MSLELREASSVPVEEAIRVAQLRAALRLFLHSSEQTAREHGLTPRQHLLLLLIKGAPDGRQRTTVRELTERMQLAESSVSELVDRAVAAGLVRREHSLHDGRVSFLYLTAAGEHRLAQVFRGLAEERRRLLGAIEGIR